ncbi:MAG: hypothetical protein K5685_11260 [Bacteroidales bacterium]|jgi:hypothetical protein|nr:hypothetical protein [Bacteroidales bacterium]
MWPFSLIKTYRNSGADKMMSKITRKMGYEFDMNLYYYYYLSEIKNWSTHISNTRKFITDCARRCCGRHTCVVLGSGCCIDVPILELSRMFETVYLVDLVHPDKVVRKMSEFKNVKFITEDITKIVSETYNCISRYKDFCVDVLISSPNYSSGRYSDILGNFDFVVSDNILSFLSYPIVKYLSKLELIDDISSRYLEEFIHRYHLQILPKGKSCIISPISEKRYNQDGLEMYDKSIVYIPKETVNDSQSWIWNFSDAFPGRVEYNVKAWEY